ncbi:efflux RND transporter periplasmic adaptor subunit [Shewanella sp. UCD-KL12]|uniref:efflux RND transporter periplasmic adaptor subunit n=1 Tax=Shewanella sp. UCD-KL12 TaxID=1917163 RepID=UPI0009707B33|nr:efflux RND transporter periplasmic adaptor subunit [Shewanella sp. UCD-KL12]
MIHTISTHRASRLWLPLATISLAVIISFVIHASAPVAPSKVEVIDSINVETLPVNPTSFTPSYTAYGSVTAIDTLTLTAQVDGQVTFIAADFIEGGRLSHGEMAFKQDDSDLQAVLSQRQAEMEIASAQLALELGEQRIAEKDYQMMLKDFNENEWQIDLELLLRKPQLIKARAELMIANNALSIARRDVERSRWYSPQDYAVTSRLVSQGDYLAKGDKIAQLVNISQLRIPLYVPRAHALQLKPGQLVQLYQPDTQHTYTAEVSHIFPMLDNQSQLQKVFARYVPQPENLVPLIIGDFVEAKLIFPAVTNTLRVPLSALDNDTIWVVTPENTLKQKAAESIFQDESHAVIMNNIDAEEQLITTKMHMPQDGLTVNLVGTH